MTFAIATAYGLPSPVSSTTTLWDNKCTFSLFHRQQQAIDYIQINAITDHANKITIDIASLRPATAVNSYTRLSKDHALALQGLLDDERLTITNDGDALLRFEVGEARWSSETAASKTDWAGCEAGRWVGSRESRVRAAC